MKTRMLWTFVIATAVAAPALVPGLAAQQPAGDRFWPQWRGPAGTGASSTATVVLRQGPKLEVLAVNELGDGFDASPALVDDELYLRGYQYLYCVAEK